MSQTNVYVIGLDGVPPRLLQEAISKGYAPEMKELRDEGAKGITKTVVPPLSMAAWSSFATGRDPGEHGIFNFMVKEEASYNTKFADGTLLHENSIPYWDYLDLKDHKTGVMNLMPGYPPSQSSGFHIGDLVTSPPKSQFIYPPELYEEIEKNVGEYLLYPYSPYTPGQSENTLNQYIDDLFSMEKNRIEVGKYLIQTKDCDVFNYVFSGSDSIQHCLAHIRDPNHPKHESKYVDDYSEKPLELLKCYDSFIGWLRDYSNSDDVVIILSDHGHSSVYDQINMNSWLYKNDYLELNSNLWTRFKTYGYNNLFDTFKSILRKSGLFSKFKDTIAQSESSDENSKSIKDLLTISKMDYDWDNTSAYTVASGGQIYLNTAKEHPEGWIIEENYEEIRESLKKDLLEIEHPNTGEKVIDTVYYGEEIYGEKYESTRPDLAVLPNDNYQIQYPQTMKTNEIFSTPPKPGSHTSENDRAGIFIASGGGAQGSDIVVNIEDYAPTIFSLLGLPVPDSMTGKARDDIFDINISNEDYDGRVLAMKSIKRVAGDIDFIDTN